MDPILEKLVEVTATQREILANQSNQQKILEKHSDILDSQREILIRNTAIVDEHQRRSTLLEQAQENIRSDVADIKTHVNGVRFLGKTIKLSSYVISIIVALYEGFKLIHWR